MTVFTIRSKKQKPVKYFGRISRWVFSAAVWLILWQIAAAAVQEEILLVSPFSVLFRLGELARTE